MIAFALTLAAAVLGLWIAVGIPFALFLGRFLRHCDAEDRAREGMARELRNL